MEYSLATAGLFRANPESNVENLTRLVDATTPGTAATDSGTVNVGTLSASNINGVRYTGKDGQSQFIQFFHEEQLTQKRIPVTLAATVEAKTLQDAIHDVLLLHEVDPVLSVTKAGQIFTIEHTGAGTLSDIVVDGADVSLSRAALASVGVAARATSFSGVSEEE